MEENENPGRVRGRVPKIGRKRTADQQKYDKMYCSNLFLKGYTYENITKALNKHNAERGMDYQISVGNVFNDIKKCLIDWKRARLEHIDDYINAEIQKLDKLEVEAWEAWEKSKTGKLKDKTRKSKKPNKMDAEMNEPDYYGYDEQTVETSSGNPKFLDILLNVQQRRAKLLGFDAPAQLNVNNIDRSGDLEKPKYDVSDIPKDLLFKIADQMQDAEAIRIAASKGLVN